VVESFEESCVGFGLLSRLIMVVSIPILFFNNKLHSGLLGLEVIVHDVSRLSICWHLVHVHFFFFICEVVIR
jgi:hypothetical protein